MSTVRQRGSRISRTIAYFKESELEEARIVWTRVNEIMSERLGPPKPKRTRRARVSPASVSPHLSPHTIAHAATTGGE